MTHHDFSLRVMTVLPGEKSPLILELCVLCEMHTMQLFCGCMHLVTSLAVQLQRQDHETFQVTQWHPMYKVQDQRQTVLNCSDHYKSKKGQWINTTKLSWYSTAAPLRDCLLLDLYSLCKWLMKWPSLYELISQTQ